MWLVSSTDRMESTHYAFAIEDYTSIVQIFFSLQKTSELWSFYKEMTLFGLWLFCYFWIKTFYFSVWLNNVLWNHFKWPIWNRFTFNPLHPNISMYILHTVLYTFPKELTRRICLTIKDFLGWWLFPLLSQL